MLTNTHTDIAWRHVCDMTTRSDGTMVENIEFMMCERGDLTAQVSINGDGLWVGTIHHNVTHADVIPEISHASMFHIMRIIEMILDRAA